MDENRGPSLPYFGSDLGAGDGYLVIDPLGRLVVPAPALKQAPPPGGGVQGPRAVVQRRVDVGEEVPDVPDDDPHDLILGHGAVQHEAEPHQHPRQVRRGEDQQAQEAQPRVRVPPRPDVDEGRGEGVAQEGHRHEWRQADQAGHGVEEEPGEVCGRIAARFFKKARVALEEEDVEEKVEGERAEVEEGCQEPPVLLTTISSRALPIDSYFHGESARLPGF